ncbi:MAG: amidohydrolase [Xanthomonadales bacterium]|nr:amidohydrolase [Xanthomonadales bacterium]
MPHRPPRFLIRSLLFSLSVAAGGLAHAADAGPGGVDDAMAAAGVAEQLQALAGQTIAWRRDIHQHPELGEQETRTAALVADHLRGLGLEPRTGIAGTGVSAILRGARPGPRIALRADMDALPVLERTGLTFASSATGTWRGETVPVMHACGHDAHVAILMTVAQLLAEMREQLAGEVMFVFQPAEEGPPEPGAIAGAARMLDEGLFADFVPEAVYGLHVTSALPVGQVGYRSGAMMAAADEWILTVSGRQTHGSRPWEGIDPITVAAQILLASQGIIARQVDTTVAPVVLTAGQIRGGIRFNIIPDEVTLAGTLRTFDEDVRANVIERLRLTADHIARASGASAHLAVASNAPLTRNDPVLAERAGAVLTRTLGADQVLTMPLLTIAEDFSQYTSVAPGFFHFVGVTPVDQDPRTAPANHSPEFFIDEAALAIGTRTLLALALDQLLAR